MPLYEYKCPKDGVVAQDIRPWVERNNVQACPRCYGPMDRQVSAPHGVVKNPAVPKGRQ